MMMEKLKDDREKAKVPNFYLAFHLFHQGEWSSNWKGKKSMANMKLKPYMGKETVKNNLTNTSGTDPEQLNNNS